MGEADIPREDFIEYLEQVQQAIGQVIARARADASGSLHLSGEGQAGFAVAVGAAFDATAASSVDPGLTRRVWEAARELGVRAGEDMLSGPLGDAGNWTLGQLMDLAKAVIELLQSAVD